MVFLRQLQIQNLVIRLVGLQFQLVFAPNDNLHKQYDQLLHVDLHNFVVQKLDRLKQIHLLKNLTQEQKIVAE